MYLCCKPPELNVFVLQASISLISLNMGKEQVSSLWNQNYGNLPKFSTGGSWAIKQQRANLPRLTHQVDFRQAPEEILHCFYARRSLYTRTVEKEGLHKCRLPETKEKKRETVWGRRRRVKETWEKTARDYFSWQRFWGPKTLPAVLLLTNKV